MMPRTTVALFAVAALASSGCIEASRPLAQDTAIVGDTDAGGGGADVAPDSVVADTVAPDTTVVPCGGDGDCQALVAGEMCKTARCADQRCVVETVEDETPCGEAACDGASWSAAASCREGFCVAPAPVVCASLPGSCEDVSCDAERGCVSSPKQEGTACVTGDGALLCEDMSWHPQDSCDDSGHCIEAPPEPCTSGFCEVPICDASNGCGVQDVGVDPGAVGEWRFVYLRSPAGASAVSREVFGARGTLTLDDEGKWHRGTVEASAAGAMPAVSVSSFCVGDDGALALAFGLDGAEPNAILGQLTPARDLFFAVSYLRAELMVAVKAPSQNLPTAATAARYHMVGMVKKAVSAEMYAIDGVLSFGADGCLDRPATYQRSDQDLVVTIPTDGACLTFAPDGTVSFPHTESISGRAGAPITLSGFSLPTREVLVMAIDTATDVFPSLVLLVREGADVGPSALHGTYAFGGLAADTEEGLDRVGGTIVYDGQGLVTAYDAFLGEQGTSGGGGPQDRYTVAIANPADTGNFAGSYTHDVAVGADRDRRLGQVSPRAATGDTSPGLSPVVVHVPATSTWHLEPGLEIAIRHQ